MRILIVEDEPKTAAYLRKGLSEQSFVVDVAEQGVDGLHLIRTGLYDLVILDVMLPQRDGWAVLTEMRQGGMQTPVLFVTARDTVEDRVKGLELVETTTWSSPSLFQNCWRACVRSCAAARFDSPITCVWQIWRSTCCASVPDARAGALS